MRRLIDLHLHLDGSVPFAAAKEIMARQGMALSDKQLRQKMSVSPKCRNLIEFLQKFPFADSLMQTRSDLQLITATLLKELKKQGLVYVEIRFAPQLHTKQGLSQEEVVASVRSGIDQFLVWQKNHQNGQLDLHANLILCLMRLKDNEKHNWKTIEVAKEFLGQGVCGIDLAGAETPEFAARKYAAFFKKAQKENIPYTIHAGEAMGPESIREALDLGAKRIGHGISCVQDPNLVKRIIKDQITLECCATSNLNTKAFNKKIDSYPVRKLLHQGVRVTLNSDDMTVSNITLPHDYRMLEDKTGLTKAEEKQLYLNAARAAFCSSTEKERLLSLI